MRAVIIKKHGDSKVLSYTNIKKPKNMSDHVIIKVRYCALNHLDLRVRNGLCLQKIKFPHILGSDICGNLENDIEGFSLGDEVVVYPVINDVNSINRLNMISGCSDYNGGYAEFVRVPKQCIVKKPQWLSTIESCALNVSYLTVWNILQTLDCKVGDEVFVWGGNSGIGTASILLAKSKGCNVTTTVSEDNKIELMKKIGANVVINRKKNNVLKLIRKNTSKGVDHVIDHVGTKTWPTSINMLKVGGKMATCGVTTGNHTKVNISDIYNKRINIFGIYMGYKSQLVELHKFMKLKKITPIIDSIINLQDARLAHRKLESGQHFGKIILKAN